MSQTQPLDIIIVEKTGQLKLLSIKDYKESELFKKCGFKQCEGFKKQHQWTTKIDGVYYIVSVFAKTDGRANSENKYDFPPPIDTKLFFGNCAIVAIKQYVKENNDSWSSYINLTIELWTKIYEKLFGGFEDLAATAIEDENEIDELKNVPKEKKTKSGYLKDGFVVDSSDTEDEEYTGSDDEEEDDDNDREDSKDENEEGEEELNLEDVGSELSDDEYDYSSEVNND
jgi:hypothetical protein